MSRSSWIIILLSVSFLSSKAQDSIFTGAAGIEFIQIKPGSFVYGKYQPQFPEPDSFSTERGYTEKHYQLARHLAIRDAQSGFKVIIPKSFYLGRFEITQRQWKQVMKRNPSFFKGESLPVENISWSDAQQFINKLNERDSHFHYRLPREFEWEYAARAGNEDDIAWEEIRLQAQIGNRSTSTIGTKKPNAWGLYDMLGNVWEWTQDVYNEKMFADSIPSTEGSQHVLKGASFTGDVKNATYMTHAAGPGNKWDIGLRIVMEPITKHVSSTRIMKYKPPFTPINGWHLSRTSHQGTTPSVTYKNGIITLMQHPYGQGGVLLTNKKYSDFELTVDVKIDSFCNGGIFLRSTESGQAYQVELAEPGGTGNLFGEMLRISKPGEADNKKNVWKAGDWNHFRIRMTGAIPRIALWINGTLMYNVQEPENDFITGASQGMIGLQVHWTLTYSPSAKAFDMSGSWRPGSKQQFRNLRIRELK
jgi:sulfatase modifying factor 1